MKKYSLALLLPAILLLAAGCKIDNNSGVIPTAAFRVIHFSPDAPSLDVYANGGLVQANLAYDNSTGYRSATAGTYNIKMAETGTSNFLIDASINLSAGKTYSIFAIDSAKKIKAVATLDDFTLPSADSVRVRFLHFSTNTGTIDLAETDSSSALFASRTFNDQYLSSTYASYTLLPAGTYNLEIRPAGAPTVLLSLPGTVLSGGHAYTICAKGFSGGTGTQAFGVNIITDYP